MYMEDTILRFNYHLKNVPFGLSYHAAMEFEVEFEEGDDEPARHNALCKN